MLPEVDLVDLGDSIEVSGLRHPIMLFEGKILDGRNRYLACIDRGTEPKFEEWRGTASEAITFVWDENSVRRQLTSSQKAACHIKRGQVDERYREAGEVAVLAAKDRQREGGKKAGRSHPAKVTELIPQAKESGLAATQTARAAGTNRKYIEHAQTIQEKAPEKLEEVARGEKTIPQAMREIRKEEVREEVRLPSSKYRVVYADPPWSYGNSGVIGDSDNYGHVERHYDSMTIPELCAMDVASILEDNAVLFMWVTSPLLSECWPVIKVWGFKYKTSIVWDKDAHNFGHYVSVRHELLLICTNGSCTPDISELLPSVVKIKRSRKHSEKPCEFRQMIEKMYPHGRRIELFARAKAEGWDGFGNELPE
tara:strand:- start:792 stop:1892 length:1101 start_codon:yes stop_codon:yes gene_type:complete